MWRQNNGSNGARMEQICTFVVIFSSLYLLLIELIDSVNLTILQQFSSWKVDLNWIHELK